MFNLYEICYGHLNRETTPLDEVIDIPNLGIKQSDLILGEITNKVQKGNVLTFSSKVLNIRNNEHIPFLNSDHYNFDKISIKKEPLKPNTKWELELVNIEEVLKIEGKV